MPFKLTRQPGDTADTPEALFRDLRKRQVVGLLAHQADILRASHETRVDASDVALQLPTGSGKTLVGLLIGEWRRRRSGERVLSLCPTRQLVHQVAEQAGQKYGIRTNAFTGSQKEYRPDSKAEYLNSETLAITTYCALFNTNPFFANPNVILLDDAHTAENSIANHWSLTVLRKEHQAIFEAIVSLLEPFLPRIYYQRLVEPVERPWDAQWVEKIPSPRLATCADQLTALLDVRVGKTGLQYPWSLLRDHLRACQGYLSTHSVLIRPVIPPRLTHAPFAKAQQRVYMSATLGAGGDLERITGVEAIHRLPIPPGWDKQGIGRRLFFFPERSLDEGEAQRVAMEMIKRTPRSVVLVPDGRTATTWKESIHAATGFSCLDAEQIEQSKHDFVGANKVVAVMASRYDGIDFVGDQCRLLIVQHLPRATNLQEQFITSRLAASVLLNDRIQTRLVQAVGRCTRSATDYSAVVVLGDTLNNYFMERQQRAALHPEIQAELEFGIDPSKDLKEPEFLENFEVFLSHGDEWNAADEYILTRRTGKTQKEPPGTDKLRAAVRHEVRYQYCLWHGDYESAVRECGSVLTALSGDEVRGYRAFWYYLAGSAAWLGAQACIPALDAVARRYFGHAAGAAEGVRWLFELARLGLAEGGSTTEDGRLAAVIEGLETRLESRGRANDRRFEQEVNSIISGLNQEEAGAFETAHVQLGALLGYEAGNSTATAAPDPWWIAGDDLCFVAEDHSDSAAENALGATKVRQGVTHPDWIRKNVMLRADVEIVSSILSPCQSVDPDARTYAGEVCYWNLEEFRRWATFATGVVRKLRSSFPGPGDPEWRRRAAQEYRDAGLDPASLKARLLQSRLSAMDTT